MYVTHGFSLEIKGSTMIQRYFIQHVSQSFLIHILVFNAINPCVLGVTSPIEQLKFSLQSMKPCAQEPFTIILLFRLF